MKRTFVCLVCLMLINFMQLRLFADDISTDDLSLEFTEKDYSMFSSRLLNNPLVQEMVDSVSADRIISNVTNLVSFYTRHTNSDTVSPDSGIGAVRRWIFDQFQAYSQDSSAVNLEPGYFTFDATAGGISSEHRNVLATMPGLTTPERYFLVMDHISSRNINFYNSTSYALSSNDDGSGTAIAMEIARVLSGYSFESTAIVMIVTDENQKLYGSKAYAQWARTNDKQIETVITNDVVGNIAGFEESSNPSGAPFTVSSVSVRHFSGLPESGLSCQLIRYMKLKAIEYVPGFTVNLIPAIDCPDHSGNHVPFDNSGYPAARFTVSNENDDGSDLSGRQHNEHDTISAYNTNAGYMANIAKINIAGIASLALAPTTPSGLKASEVGNGNSVFLTWPSTQTEPDFTGYRIAVRPDSQLFYSDVIDAGNINEFTVTGLTEDENVFLSISAYDIDNNESIFSEEISFTPTSFPQAPESLDIISQQDGIYLSWAPNIELDIGSYRVYRFQRGQNVPDLISTIPHPVTEWFDEYLLSAHTVYSYFVTAVDIDQIESNGSDTMFGQLATHDMGILVLDGTLDGYGEPLQPTDQEVDDYYAAILSDFNVGGFWDIADSNNISRNFSDAHLAPYSVVFLHSDRINSSLQQDTASFKKYLDNGGHLFVCGWNMAYSLAGVTSDYFDFSPGSFFRDYLKVDSLGVSPPSNQDFIGALSQIPDIYPNLVIDTTKVTVFDHRLIKMDAFLSPLVDEPLTQALYKYQSSLGSQFRLHDEPVGLRYMGQDFQIVFFDVPLFFMEQEPASQAIKQALLDLGEVFTFYEQDEFSEKPERFKLYANYPNPFNLSTTIMYNLPDEEYIRVAIYNLLGQEVKVLVDGVLPAGVYTHLWEAYEFPTGIYFCRLEGSGGADIIRMVLLK